MGSKNISKLRDAPVEVVHEHASEQQPASANLLQLLGRASLAPVNRKQNDVAKILQPTDGACGNTFLQASVHAS